MSVQELEKLKKYRVSVSIKPFLFEDYFVREPTLDRIIEIIMDKLQDGKLDEKIHWNIGQNLSLEAIKKRGNRAWLRELRNKHMLIHCRMSYLRACWAWLYSLEIEEA